MWLIKCMATTNDGSQNFIIILDLKWFFFFTQFTKTKNLINRLQGDNNYGGDRFYYFDY